jgi:hypothetical protein
MHFFTSPCESPSLNEQIFTTPNMPALSGKKTAMQHTVQ